MRGTPLLVQIYLIYYGLGQVFGDITMFGKPLMRVLPFLRDGIYYAIFALSMNTAGYTGEILRGAILAVPHGEIEAGQGLRHVAMDDLPPHHPAARDPHLPADHEHGNDPAAEGDVAGVDGHGL